MEDGVATQGNPNWDSGLLALINVLRLHDWPICRCLIACNAHYCSSYTVPLWALYEGNMTPSRRSFDLTGQHTNLSQFHEGMKVANRTRNSGRINDSQIALTQVLEDILISENDTSRCDSQEGRIAQATYLKGRKLEAFSQGYLCARVLDDVSSHWRRILILATDCTTDDYEDELSRETTYMRKVLSHLITQAHRHITWIESYINTSQYQLRCTLVSPAGHWMTQWALYMIETIYIIESNRANKLYLKQVHTTGELAWQQGWMSSNPIVRDLAQEAMYPA